MSNRASRALTMVYIGDIETVLNLVPYAVCALDDAQKDAIERLRFRAARTKTSVTGEPFPSRPEAEERLPE